MTGCRLIAALALMALLAGCIPVSPLLPLLSATARAVFDNGSEERPTGPISVDQLLAQTQDRVVACEPSDGERMHMALPPTRFSDAQKTRMADFAAALLAKGVRQVIIIAGSTRNSRNLNTAFTLFQRARIIARLMNDLGLLTRIKMDPNRPPGAVDIIAVPRTETRDA